MVDKGAHGGAPSALGMEYEVGGHRWWLERREDVDQAAGRHVVRHLIRARLNQAMATPRRIDRRARVIQA